MQFLDNHVPQQVKAKLIAKLNQLVGVERLFGDKGISLLASFIPQITAVDYELKLRYEVQSRLLLPKEGDEGADAMWSNLLDIFRTEGLVMPGFSDEDVVRSVILADQHLRKMDRLFSVEHFSLNEAPPLLGVAERSFDVTDPRTYPTGATILFGSGGTGKTRFARGLAPLANAAFDGAYAYIPLDEPDMIANTSADELGAAVESVLQLLPPGKARVNGAKAMIMIDSFRLVLRLAPGAAKKGGLSPGFDRAIGSLNALGHAMGIAFLVAVNPSDSSMDSVEVNELAHALGDGSMGMIHVHGHPSTGVWNMRKSARPERLGSGTPIQTVTLNHVAKAAKENK